MTDTLGAGAIAFTGYTHQLNDVIRDSFNFVALTDIAAGTVIKFTDNNWDGAAFGTSESTWTWTATSDIAAGSAVTLDNLIGAYGQPNAPTSNLGTMTYSGPVYPAYAEFSAETLYAYVGDASAPVFLSAFSTWPYYPGQSLLEGTGLTAGINAINVSGIVPGATIAAYHGVTSGYATFDDYRSALANAANWDAQSYIQGSPYNDGLPPDAPLPAVPLTIDPAVQTVSFATQSLVVAVAEGGAGQTTALTFTVVRSGSTTGDLTFSGSLVIPADSGIDLADFGGVLPTFSGVIAAGQNSATVTINVAGDIKFEADESFQVKLDNVSNPASATNIGGFNAATATIVNDDPAQSVAFASDSRSVTVIEGDDGTKTLVFTIERSGGGNLGDLNFTVQLQPNDANVNNDDFAGAMPGTVHGVIADGQSSATISVTISGDTRYEADDYFQLVLTAVDNAPVGAVIDNSGASASVVISNDDPVPTGLPSGSFAEGPITVGGTDHLVIGQGAVLHVATDTPITWVGANSAATIDNDGSILTESSAAFKANANARGSLTLNNNASGIIERAIDLNNQRTGSSLVINNAGLLDGVSSYALRISTQGGLLVLNNLATGVITNQDAGSDVIKNGKGAIINNQGRIVSAADGYDEFGNHLYGGDAIDVGNGTDDIINNLNGGVIEGSHHAITGKSGITVINDAGASLIGRNGSGVNVDNNADVANTVYVTNFGTMEGRSATYEDSDGDAIDADGLAFIQNWGSIKGLGANGLHNGEVNISEGIAIGGGTIINYGGGEIYGYGRGIQVDNSSNSDAYSATSIFNAGTIRGDGHGPEGVNPDHLDDIDLRGREAVSLVGNWADAFTNGVTGKIIGGVDMGGGDDAFRNDGTATATGGAAINLGDGNDAFTNYGTITGEVLLGTGNDVAHLITGSSIAGTLDGGDDTDALLLSGSGSGLGSVAAVKNFETIDVQGGTWLLHDTGGAALVTVENGASLIVIGAADATTVEQGGKLYVYGSATGSMVSGQQLIAADAVATGTIIAAGGEQIVNSGAMASDTVLAGGSQQVWGSADDTVVGSGGLQYVHGVVTDTTVDAGGQQNVYTDGTATGSIVKTGAVQIDWGAAAGTTIEGGIQYVWGTATDTTIVSGVQHVGDGATATGTTIGSGGTEYVHTGGAAHDVAFAGPNATLVLDQSSDLSGTVSGWQFGDVIDFGNIAFDEVGTTFGYAENVDHSGGTLTITDGTHTATLSLLGQYTASDFALSSDGHGGTVLTDPSDNGVQVQNLLAPAHAA